MLGMGKTFYVKKWRAKRMGVSHKCAKWIYDMHYRNKRMVSLNREDKIQFKKDGMNKNSLDDIF